MLKRYPKQLWHGAMSFVQTSTKCFLYSSMLESLKFSMCLLGGPNNMMLTSKQDVGPYVVYD